MLFSLYFLISMSVHLICRAFWSNSKYLSWSGLLISFEKSLAAALKSNECFINNSSSSCSCFGVHLKFFFILPFRCLQWNSASLSESVADTAPYSNLFLGIAAGITEAALPDCLCLYSSWITSFIWFSLSLITYSWSGNSFIRVSLDYSKFLWFSLILFSTSTICCLNS